MSDPKIGRERNVKGRQTVMGDFFSKSNKSKKTVKTQEEVAETETGRTVVQTKTKETAVQNKKAQAVAKKTDKAVEKKQEQKASKAVEKKPSLPVEKKTSLKRKVTGAGMFSFSWTRGAQRDTEEYRNGYPGKEDHPDQDDNLRFYMNQLSSKPDGDFIDKIHVDWWGDYRLLEVHHGYIQWLFPIRESGLNWHAQELQLHEIKRLQRNKNAMKRILTSYKMMLDFYGMKLANEDDGTIVRAENWRDRFKHLNRSYHNYLRITRILKSLGEFGYEHLKKNFVMFILNEGLVEGTLSNLIDSCVKYWIGVLKEDEEREEVFDYYEKLIEEDNLKPKRRNRSPSPPGYSSYWSNKDTEKKSKNASSKKDKDGKKDEVNGDDAKANNENELSDGEDGALYYAMSLIDEDVPDKKDSKSKTRKDHEMSDSDGVDEYNQEESQEMAHWNEESKKASEKDMEGGSDCCDSSPETDVKENVDTENADDSTEETRESVNEKNIKSTTGLDDNVANLNEEKQTDTETKDDDTNKIDGTEKEGNDKDIADTDVNEKGDGNHRIEEISSENSGKGIAKETIDSSEGKQEKMDTNETQNHNLRSNVENGKVEETSLKTEDELSCAPVTEMETNGEEKMET